MGGLAVHSVAALHRCGVGDFACLRPFYRPFAGVAAVNEGRKVLTHLSVDENLCVAGSLEGGRDDEIDKGIVQ